MAVVLPLGACGNQPSDPDDGGVSSPHFSRQSFDQDTELQDYGGYSMMVSASAPTDDVQMDALLTGRLSSNDQGCLISVNEETDESFAVLFAQGTSMSDGTVTLPGGEQLVVGASFSLGGGTLPAEARLPQELREACGMHSYPEVLVPNAEQ